jgi:F-type H+-transporting ATPase subunit a
MDVNISLAAEKLFSIGPFRVTNSILTAWIVIVLITIFFAIGRRKLSIIPSKLQAFIEMIYELLSGLARDIAGVYADKFLPLVGAFFIFILVGNWFGLLPGVGTIYIKETVKEAAAESTTSEHDEATIVEERGEGTATGEDAEEVEEVPLLRGASADLNMTMALALISILVTQVIGVQHQGLRYFSKFFNFKNIINAFVGVLELISEFAKIISFSFRLFGNIFAGEVLLIVMAALGGIFIFLPLPFLFLEIFVGLIQALVFTMLSLVFFKMAAEGHGE